MNTHKNKKKYFNSFLALLRIYLSFIVVNAHCFNHNKNIIKNKHILIFLKNNIHVPTFFIMSFYFCYNLFESKNISRIKQRFKRIIFPYIIWPIIIWILNNIFKFILKLQLKNSFNDLKIQLLTGHCFLTVLWFQYDLIFISLLIFIIVLLFNKNVIFILVNLQLFVYYLQYSNINYNFFSKYGYYKKYTFGRIAEVLPYCITGYILANLKIIEILKKYKLKSLYFLLVFFIFFIKYKIFFKINGFFYQGIKLHILSLILFIIFSIFPSEKIDNIYFVKIIKLISNNTSGIYYMHKPTMLYLEKYFLLIKNKTFLGSIIIFIICNFISLLGIKFFGKTSFKNLFQ